MATMDKFRSFFEEIKNAIFQIHENFINVHCYTIYVIRINNVEHTITLHFNNQFQKVHVIFLSVISHCKVPDFQILTTILPSSTNFKSL